MTKSSVVELLDSQPRLQVRPQVSATSLQVFLGKIFTRIAPAQFDIKSGFPQKLASCYWDSQGRIEPIKSDVPFFYSHNKWLLLQNTFDKKAT